MRTVYFSYTIYLINEKTVTLQAGTEANFRVAEKLAALWRKNGIEGWEWFITIISSRKDSHNMHSFLNEISKQNFRCALYQIQSAAQ